jgi:MoxR-like ATPase
LNTARRSGFSLTFLGVRLKPDLRLRDDSSAPGFDARPGPKGAIVAKDVDAFENERQVVEKIHESRGRIEHELGKVIIGQKDATHQLLISLFAGGHCLITGAPGLAKTLLVRTIAQLFHLKFQRIQFTPDLMPADITGTEILEETGDGHRRLQFVKGPIFAHVILADEINRTPPKTQAALLEAMQEHQVTAAGVRYPLEEPFFVLATQNPIEMEGTYPLPEAQLDRFMFNVIVDYLPEDEEVAVVQQTTSRKTEPIEPLFDGQDVLDFQEIVRRVPVAEDLVRHAVRLAAASRPGPQAPEFVNQWVSWGAGLRAAQSLVLGAKARALLRGRFHVEPDDIRALVHPTLRHRILLGYRAEADGVGVDAVIDRLLDQVKGPKH